MPGVRYSAAIVEVPVPLFVMVVTIFVPGGVTAWLTPKGGIVSVFMTDWAFNSSPNGSNRGNIIFFKTYFKNKECLFASLKKQPLG